MYQNLQDFMHVKYQSVEKQLIELALGTIHAVQ